MSNATRTSPNKQQLRTERSTNALLDAASELITEGGFASLTLAAVGERAGLSRGMVTARFGSKDGLIEALIDRIVTRWSHRNVLPRTAGMNGFEGMSILLDAIRRQTARDPRGLRVLYALMFEALGPDAQLRARFAHLHEAMRSDYANIVRKGQRDGSITKRLQADREGTLIIAGLRGIGYQWLLDPERFDPVQALAYLHDTTVERLRADRGERNTTSRRT